MWHFDDGMVFAEQNFENGTRLWTHLNKNNPTTVWRSFVQLAKYRQRDAFGVEIGFVGLISLI